MVNPPKELRFLYRHARPFLGRYLASIFCVTVASFVAMIDPLVMKWLLDTALPRKQLHLVIAGAATLLISHAVRLLASSVGGLLTFSAIQKMILRIRRELLHHMNGLSFDYHERTPVGERLYRVERDVDQIGEIGGDFLPTCLRLLFTSLFTLGAMLWLNPRLTCSVIPLNLLFFLLRRWFKGRLQGASDRVQRESSAASSFLQEHLAGVIQIQLLRRERSQLRTVMSAGVRKMRAQMRRRIDELTFSSTSMLTVAFGTACILTLGGYQVIRGSLTIGGFVAAYSYLTRLFDPLSNAIEIYARFNRLGASIRRVVEVLDTSPGVPQSAAAKALTVRALRGIELKQVQFSYRPDQKLFQDFDLRIRAAEKIALIGKSGSGKSTLTRLIARLHDVHQGAIFIDGMDVRSIALESLRKRLCYVSQDPVLFDRSLKDNLLLANPAASEAQLREAIELTHLSTLVAAMPDGWNTPLGPRASRLSGGERQRIAIARAILQDADVLILDEATSALDIPTEREIFRNLRAIFPDRTILFVSHRVPALAWVDRILVLENGRLMEQGSHSQLLRQDGLYARLWAMPLQDATPATSSAVR